MFKNKIREYKRMLELHKAMARTNGKLLAIAETSEWLKSQPSVITKEALILHLLEMTERIEKTESVEL